MPALSLVMPTFGARGHRGMGEGSIGRHADGRWVARLQVDGRRRAFYGPPRNHEPPPEALVHDPERLRPSPAPVRLQLGSYPRRRMRLFQRSATVRRGVVSGRGRRRRRYRLDTRWLIGPYQQHGTWSVVDNEPGGRWHHPTTRKEIQRATVAATSTGGTVRAPRRMNSERGNSSPRCRRTSPPEQGGERADVGQVRSRVNTDENREHRSGTRDRRRREEEEHRREIVDEIGEHGCDRRDQQKRAERCPPGRRWVTTELSS